MEETVHYLHWLPDETGLVNLEGHAGPVRAENPSTFLKDIVSAMEDGQAASGIRAVRHELKGQEDGEKKAAWRGLLAYALLSDMVGSQPIELVPIVPSSGPLCRSVLEVMGETAVMLLVIRDGERELPLGMTDSRFLIIPSRSMEEDRSTLFSDLPWYTEKGFQEPQAYLDPMLRDVLIKRLRAAGGGKEVQAFLKDLEDFEERLVQETLTSKRWRGDLKSVIGLMGEKGFEELTVQVTYGKEAVGSALLKALNREEPVMQIPEQRAYFFRGQAIGWESPLTLLEFGKSPQAGDALLEMGLDQQILETCVRPYAASLADRLRLRTLAPCDERIRNLVNELADRLTETATKQTGNVSLTYPWRTTSPALMNLLEEMLGPELAKAALQPFSDRLTLMSGAAFADALMERACTFTWEGGQYLVLPPISQALAAYEAEYLGNGFGYVPDSLHFVMDETGKITVSFLIEGPGGSISVYRTYTDMEQVILRDYQVPLLTVWPSIPVPQLWHAYYLSLRGRITIRVWEAEKQAFSSMTSDTDDEGGFLAPEIMRVSAYPCVILISRNDLTLGALFQSPEAFRPEVRGEAVAALDMGESGTALATVSNDGMERFHLPMLTQMLWHGSQTDFTGEVLPMEERSSLVESAVLLREGESCEPFVGGSLCPSDRLMVSRPCCHFLWRADPEGERAQQILLRQLMLEVSFDLVMHGRTSVSWHLAVPQSAKYEDWKRLEQEAQHAARDVQNLCGLPCKGAYIAWHDLRASGQYLYQALNRASFLMMDIGGGDAGIAVWLRGMAKPILEMDAGDGFAMGLHTAFLDIPLTAAQDLSVYPYLDAASFAQHLMGARESVTDWEASRQSLDDLLGSHLQETMVRFCQAVLANAASYSQSLLLLEMCRKMVLCGLAIETVGNESTLTDKLPMTMPIVLCGRGSQVYLPLSNGMQNALLNFAYLPLRETHPVKRLQLQPSPESKMEAAYGLLLQEKREEPKARITEIRGGVPMDWLLGHFLMLFNRLFPQPASLLFPGSVRNDGVLSDSYARLIVPLAASWQNGTAEEALQGCLQRLRAWPNSVPHPIQV